MDMHVVAEGKGLPTPENLANITYNTENPLRRYVSISSDACALCSERFPLSQNWRSWFCNSRDTIVVPPATFTVIRLRADIPGAWIVVCANHPFISPMNRCPLT
jgi:FtsP/CotA-like multicopper oxidase with cupredoxin domain